MPETTCGQSFLRAGIPTVHPALARQFWHDSLVEHVAELLTNVSQHRGGPRELIRFAQYRGGSLGHSLNICSGPVRQATRGALVPLSPAEPYSYATGAPRRPR